MEEHCDEGGWRWAEEGAGPGEKKGVKSSPEKPWIDSNSFLMPVVVMFVSTAMHVLSYGT